MLSCFFLCGYLGFITYCHYPNQSGVLKMIYAFLFELRIWNSLHIFWCLVVIFLSKDLLLWLEVKVSNHNMIEVVLVL